MAKPITSTRDRAARRWRSILSALGLDRSYLTGKHGPCPICEAGSDRFRFDDKGGNGTWICNQCGAGGGIDLVMRWKGLDFRAACKLIDSVVDGAAEDQAAEVRQSGDMASRGLDLWRRAKPLNGSDPASLYLRRRGITQPWPNQLRWLDRAGYRHEEGNYTNHPAMIAQYVSPDAKFMTWHLTYLDRTGRKAELPEVRKMWPGKVPDGGAVRLAASAETMGIAEGIETAMSAMQVFDVPVWAALNSNNLMKWQPPATCRYAIVFADADKNYDGQCKAFALAHRLKTKMEVEVRMPGELGCDWNDVLRAEVECR